VTLHLHGIGHFHPENEITNRFLEELDIGTDNEWIVERVGIRSRRTVLPLDYLRDTRNSDPRAAGEAALHTHPDMARRAAELAVGRAGIPIDRIGMVVSGSSAPSSSTPAEACAIAGALGLEVPAFDLNSACTTFAVQLSLLAAMDPAALPEYVLACGVATLTQRTDYNDRATAVLFGDAAVASVVSPSCPGPARVLYGGFESSPAGAGKVRIPDGGHFSQDGRAVQMFAVKRTIQQLEQLRELTGAELHFVGHQANQRVLDAVCARCDVPDSHHHSNVEMFGNTGGTSAPSVVSMGWDKWRDGEDVAVITVGAGLTWARCLLRFGQDRLGDDRFGQEDGS